MTIADKGARMANAFIDTVIILLLAIITGVLLETLYASTEFVYLLPLSIIHPFAIYFFYYFFFEFFLGKTPGKYLSKTTVIDRYGKEPSIGKILYRSLLRLAPHDLMSFIFGYTGLHDHFSHTIVVKD